MPSRDNNAGNALAEEVQTRNIRKVAINARIAAVLWILEIAANFCIVFLWLFIIGSSSSIGLTNTMLWYYIIIPYTRLMNTTYNKDRIIDDGWKSVIINSVKSIINFFGVRSIQQIEQNEKAKQIRKNNIQLSIKIKPAQEPKSTQAEPDISLISLENPSDESTLIQTTSDGRAHNKQEADKIRNQFSNQASPDLDENSLDRHSPIFDRWRKGSEIISAMYDNINDEEAYSHYLKQLLEVEYATSKTRIRNYIDFDSFDHSSYISKTCKPKRSQRNLEMDRTSSKSAKSLKNARTLDETPLNVNFVIDIDERKKQRQAILEGFLINCDHENEYENFIKLLIEFEERLIEN